MLTRYFAIKLYNKRKRINFTISSRFYMTLNVYIHFFFICMVTTYNECSLLGPNLFCLQHYNNIPFLMISLNFVTCHFFDLVNLIVDCPFKLMMCLLNENENRN